MNQARIRRGGRIGFVSLFLAALYIPLIFGVVQEDQPESKLEKRLLNRLPPAPQSPAQLAEYPAAFNRYYADHFGFRAALTRAYFRLANKLGGHSSFDDVTFGRDGWMFLGSISPGYRKFHDPMGDAMNFNLFSPGDLEAFARVLTATRDWLAARGIAYVYVIAPNKHTIYFDKLPEYVTKQNDRSATDQLVTYLGAHTDVAVVDLRAPIREERKRHPVYFKTDTHWNHYAANVAQFEIMKRVETLFPKRISPARLDDSRFKTAQRGGGDLARFANLDAIREDDPRPVFEGGCNPAKTPANPKLMAPHTLTCNTRELDALIFRDSFFEALQPYIARYFHRSTYVWERLSYATLAEYVEREKPDVVIDEVIERTLPYVPGVVFPEDPANARDRSASRP